MVSCMKKMELCDSGSKVITRAINKLKMRSKTFEVASVGLKINKAYS